jgi:hypothetical protein
MIELRADQPLDASVVEEAAWVMLQRTGYPATPELLAAYQEMVRDSVAAFLRALSAKTAYVDEMD